MYSYSSTSYQINWFGPIWRLNPFYIAATLFGEIIVVFSGVCGRSVGEYVSGIFHEQSLVTGIVSVLLTTIVIIISMFALMGYQINAGLQGITVSRQIKIWDEQSTELSYSLDEAEAPIDSLL
ncbi:hypothetical protein NECAME_08825 [Necator americanus]|uniref:Uncharacterized protein n=1 Tax=Necator americanus TaxID=51031 RepID=W2TII1_NECAM|nr:hypothetical protein NECAME_08825 [Necator americanus]ETN80976.1 hypothetical protein NECAME_08825 [Necator americanus]